MRQYLRSWQLQIVAAFESKYYVFEPIHLKTMRAALHLRCSLLVLSFGKGQRTGIARVKVCIANSVFLPVTAQVGLSSPNMCLYRVIIQAAATSNLAQPYSEFVPVTMPCKS